MPTRAQGFFLCGHMCDFIYQLLRTIVPRSCLPDEWDWEALRSLDFMQKTQFRAEAMKVAKSMIDIEREREKKGNSDAVVKTLIGESSNPFIDQGRQYIKHVARELLRQPTFKSALIFGPACFDYAALVKLPKTVAVDCYHHVYQSFSSRGWVARELQNLHMDVYLEFVDDIGHVHLDELGVGRAVEDMNSFLSECPELSRREYTWNLFKLCCHCLGHVAPKLPHVSFGSSKLGVSGVDLSCVIEPKQENLLICDSENCFTDPEPIS